MLLERVLAKYRVRRAEPRRGIHVEPLPDGIGPEGTSTRAVTNPGDVLLVDDFFVFVINGDLPRLTFHKMGRVRTEDGKMIYLTQCGAPFQTWSFRLRRDHAELLGDPCRHCWPGSYTPTKSA